MSVCAYWIGSDTTGHRCNAPSEAAGYCAKHYPIMLRRMQKGLDKRRASEARQEAAWLARNLPRLPQMRVQLDRSEAEYARRTASPITDRAAVGGDMHAGIVRTQTHHLSDSNVSRVVELERIIKNLRADIARAERSA